MPHAHNGLQGTKHGTPTWVLLYGTDQEEITETPGEEGFKFPVNDDDDKVAPGLKVTFSVVDHHLLPCLPSAYFRIIGNAAVHP